MRKEIAIYKNFMDSIKHNDIQHVQQLLAQKIDINYKVAHHYPIEVACNLGHLDIVKLLFDHQACKLRWFDYLDSNTEGYRLNLDLFNIAIATDNSRLLIFLLEICEGKNYYIHRGLSRLQKLNTAALAQNKISIKNTIQQIYTRRNAEITQLFEAAFDGNLEQIQALLKQGININSDLSGKTILHVLCERRHTHCVEILLGTSDLDVRAKDLTNEFPITIACKTKNHDLLLMLINHPSIIYYSFNDTTARAYNQSLDLIKISINIDAPETMELLLRDVYLPQELLRLDAESINEMLVYAESRGSKAIIAKLNNYQRSLTQGLSPISARSDVSISNLVGDRQSVTRFEASFINSIKRLCARYNIKICPSETGKGLYLVTDIKLDQKFQEISRMISEASNQHYCFYDTVCNLGVSHYYFREEISDAQYRKFATEIFDQIAGASSDAVNWRSNWNKDNSDSIISNAGLGLKDIWSLAVLAVQDKSSFAGQDLDQDEIYARERILVRALVDSRRAYNCNNDFLYDTGGESSQSCLHGIAVRALLYLSKLHPDIDVESNSTEWIYEIAKQEMLLVYNDYFDKKALDNCLNIPSFQLTQEQLVILNRFYELAKHQVADKLLHQVGLVKNGGYLTENNFASIISSLDSINLPVPYIDFENRMTDFCNVEDYSLARNIPVQVAQSLQFEMYKLPLTTDSFYGAIILSLKDQNVNFPQLNNTYELRNLIANFIDSALINTESFEKTISKIIAKDKISVNPAFIARIVQEKYQSIYFASSQQHRLNYVQGILRHAAADLLIVQIIAAIFACNIRIFDLQGVFIMEVYCRNIFIKPSLPLKTINIASQVYHIHGNRTIDFNQNCALVKPGFWISNIDKIRGLNITTMAAQLAFDVTTFNDFQIMPGRRVANLDQVKIPGDGNCCYNAVLIAARHANIQAAYSVQNVPHLRYLVQQELKLWLSTENAGYAEIIQSELIVAINDYNSQYNNRISTPDEYLNTIITDGCWGGHLELQLMAKIFEIKINIYYAEGSPPRTINPGAASEINLFHMINHFNILVAPNSWEPFTQTTEQETMAAGRQILKNRV